MSYIGSSASPLPVNFSAVQSQGFNGTGSQTTFTLNRSVGSVASVEVLVNNVQQSPYDGSYNITSGTSLVFSEAPSAGTNNVYVVYRDQALGSLVDTGAVRKTGDTMTGSYNFGGFISLQTADAGGYPRINGNASSAQLGLFRSTGGSEGGFYVGGDAGQFSVWSSDFVRRLNVDSSGRVTMPYQPAFFAYSSSGHITGSGQAVFGATRFNRGSNYSTSTGRFTAPVAGVYFFTAQGLPLSTVSYPFMRIWKNGSGYSADTYVINADESISISCAVEMAANDYVTVYYIDGSEGGYSHFSGFLVG